MDINAITADNAKGILIPRLNATLVKNITPSLTADQHSMLAFITEEISTSERVGNYELISGEGYYYWEWNTDLVNSRWVRVSGKFETDLRRVGNSNHITMDAGVGGTGTSAGTGESNVAIGKGSLNAITTGSNNVAMGANALGSLSTAFSNVAIGNNALSKNNGNHNIAIGGDAMAATTSGSSNTALGTNALKANTEGKFNTAIGTNALPKNTTGSNNVAIGVDALSENTTAQGNTAIGQSALKLNTTGVYNTAIGYKVLEKNTTGSYNISMGAPSMSSNTTGGNNLLGNQTLNKNISGESNIALNAKALESNTTGRYNIAMGFESMRTNEVGIGNLSLGYRGLYHSKGDYNTGVGYMPGTFILGGNGNMHIGNIDNQWIDNNAGFNNTIFIGHRMAPPVQTNDTDLAVPNTPNADSNTILLGNDTTQGPKVGIGTYKPEEKLEVAGAIRSSINANIGGHVVLLNDSKINADGKLATKWKIYNLGKQTTGNQYTNSLQFWSYGQKTDGTPTDNKSQMMLTDEGKLAVGFPSNHEPKERLELFGAIKLNTTSTNCDTQSQGTLRFNTGTKKFQGCNGTIWVNLH
ncbi:hypothetical protein [Bergeyella zoohelcum]|uniref:hypothetical protein n=1 Tax=Bergeyella zoohelcum TaxID=1015 RepID=UPI002A91E055|nr:hypothetical protein [Bergeyella zoohelcum]MDY6025189.1 hypothetical protein [Bergeyella zoohelcum]